MSIGASIVLIALGAILAFAVNLQVSGIELQTVGMILMVVGAIGFVASLVLGASRRRGGVVTEQYVDDRAVY